MAVRRPRFVTRAIARVRTFRCGPRALQDEAMNALASDLVRQTSELSESVTRSIPGSQKIYATGSRADLRVPMREVALSDTPLMFGAQKNAPLALYDTSGPYTDPQAHIDLL